MSTTDSPLDPPLKEQSSVEVDKLVPMDKVKCTRYDRIKAFENKSKMAPNEWIIVRVDGRNFHRFVEEHDFIKPNDEQALKLMNSCAVAIVEEFKDVIFAYGYSDEYSFVFKKTSDLFGRRVSKLETVTASLFTAHYVMKWKEFFPEKDLRSTPSFDGRAVCYNSDMDLRTYLAWRQEDCMRSNRYNTCFWMLVKSGKSKKQAQRILEGTHTPEKNELLSEQFGIDYNTLPAIFRKGSCFFHEVHEVVKYTPSGDPVTRLRKKVVGDHCDLIGKGFWQEHPGILDE